MLLSLRYSMNPHTGFLLKNETAKTTGNDLGKKETSLQLQEIMNICKVTYRINSLRSSI